MLVIINLNKDVYETIIIMGTKPYDTLEFRTFLSLNQEEKETLMALTFKREGKRSLFQQWLQHPNPLGMYAVLVKKDNEIIAWAATSTRDGWNKGTIGVYIKSEHRRQNVARDALDTLLEHLSECKITEPIPEYLIYEYGMEQLFRPLIENRGFKDYYRCEEEYDQREPK